MMVISLAVPRDEETSAITGLNKGSNVETQFSIEGSEFKKEVFEKFIERFKAEGYAVIEDIGPSENLHARVVTLEGHGVRFRIQMIWGSNENKATYDITIPILSE